MVRKVCVRIARVHRRCMGCSVANDNRCHTRLGGQKKRCRVGTDADNATLYKCHRHEYNYPFVVLLLHFCYNCRMNDRLFGSASRTDALVTIGRLGRTYISEIARILSRRSIEVQRAVASLEQAGVVVSNRVGNTRIVELSPTFPAKDELYALLLRISEMPTYADRWSKIRRRPRAMGKSL